MGPSTTSFIPDNRASGPFSVAAVENILKTVRNALLVSLACTGMLFAYYAVSGQSEEIRGLWFSGIAMFFGVFGYLLFAGRRRTSKHRK